MKSLRVRLAAALLLLAVTTQVTTGTEGDIGLSAKFRDALRRISNHITFAEKTKELCDLKHPHFQIGKYTNLSVWEEGQRLHGAKAFIAGELGRIDSEFRETLLRDAQETKQWFGRLGGDELEDLCAGFLRQYRASYLTDKPGDQNLLSMYGGFYHEAEQLFPRYFTQAGSDRWARADPVSLGYRALPEKMAWWFGEIVEDGRVIYAEKPRNADIGYTALASAFIVVDAAMARRQGSKITADDTEWHRVEPPSDGFTLEGEFTAYDTVGFSTVFGVAGRSSTKAFSFTRDGRFHTAEDKSVFAAERSAGASRTSKAQGGGIYRVSGYKIELRPDRGKPVSLPFFPYEAGTFRANSSKRGDIVYLNLDGRLYLASGG